MSGSESGSESESGSGSGSQSGAGSGSQIGIGIGIGSGNPPDLQPKSLPPSLRSAARRRPERRFDRAAQVPGAARPAGTQGSRGRSFFPLIARAAGWPSNRPETAFRKLFFPVCFELVSGEKLPQRTVAPVGGRETAGAGRRRSGSLRALPFRFVQSGAPAAFAPHSPRPSGTPAAFAPHSTRTRGTPAACGRTLQGHCGGCALASGLIQAARISGFAGFVGRLSCFSYRSCRS